MDFVRLPLEGGANVRDIGGYPTSDNKVTKFHVFVRSSRLTNLTTKDNEFLLIVQPRPVKDGFLVEFPAGYVEDKENPLISAKRELIEETGYYSDNIKYLDSFYQDQGCSEAYNYAYLALDCEKVKEQKLDKEEFVRYFLCNYDEVLELVKMGYIKDIQAKYALELAKKYIKRR